MREPPAAAAAAAAAVKGNDPPRSSDASPANKLNFSKVSHLNSAEPSPHGWTRTGTHTYYYSPHSLPGAFVSNFSQCKSLLSFSRTSSFFLLLLFSSSTSSSPSSSSSSSSSSPGRQIPNFPPKWRLAELERLSHVISRSAQSYSSPTRREERRGGGSGRRRKSKSLRRRGEERRGRKGVRGKEERGKEVEVCFKEN